MYSCSRCCWEPPPPPPLQAQALQVQHVFTTRITTAALPLTTQPTAFASVTAHPPFVITDNRQRGRESLAIPRPLPASNPALVAPVPTAPPAPEATEFYWTKTQLAHTQPSVLLVDGFYAGRIVSGRNTLPAILETRRAVEPSSGGRIEYFVGAHYFYRNQAGSTEEYEVLSCRKTSWKPAMGGYVVPDNAILCGRTASGRALYFGRAFDEGTYHFGTADPEVGLLYSVGNVGTWYGCVRTSRHFDILVAA